jgi:hypothetical protein
MWWDVVRENRRQGDVTKPKTKRPALGFGLAYRFASGEGAEGVGSDVNNDDAVVRDRVQANEQGGTIWPKWPKAERRGSALGLSLSTPVGVCCENP